MRLRRCFRMCLLASGIAATQPAQNRGRVVDILTGRGIPGVQVHVTAPDYRPEHAADVISDANGDFLFPSGTPSFKMPGYRPLSFGGPSPAEFCCIYGYDIEGRPIGNAPTSIYPLMPQADLSGV